MARDLSVIIVNWNAGGLLRDCVESVYRETLKYSPQVIIVDNASSDDSVARVEKEFPEAVIIKNAANLGFAKGNNIGVEAAEGRYVVLLNPDARVTDRALDKLCGFLESAGAETGAAGPVLLNGDGSFQTQQGSRFPTLGTAFSQYLFLGRILGLPGIFMNRAPSSDGPRRVDWLCGACLACETEVYRQGGRPRREVLPIRRGHGLLLPAGGERAEQFYPSGRKGDPCIQAQHITAGRGDLQIPGREP